MKILSLCLILLVSFIGYTQQEDPVPDSIRSEFSPGDHELIIMPTAYTMEKGTGYFSSYEIFLLNTTYAFSQSTHVGAFFGFPITKDFLEILTLGVKQNYYKSEYFQGAVWVSYTLKNQLYTVGNIFSVGHKETSFHAGFGFAGEEHGSIFLILLGGRYDFSKKVSGIIEYTNAKELLDLEFNGLITFGIKFRSESIAWELAGVRPLEETGDFLLAPILKASFFF